MKKVITCLAIVIICVGFNHAIAQTVKYSGLVNIGALYGSNKTKVQIQTIHGVAYQTWFAGVGVTIDDYFEQSVPLFLDVRKDILNKPATPFLYIDGGVNLANKKTQNDWRKTDMDPGLFYEGGAGYKFALNEKLDLNLAIGYSFKGYKENTYGRATQPTPPYRTDEWILSNVDKYSLQRLVMKIGLQF